MDEIGTRAPGVTTIPADQATKSRSAAVQALAAITGGCGRGGGPAGSCRNRSSGVLHHGAQRGC
jgi:hypothetical protein